VPGDMMVLRNVERWGDVSWLEDRGVNVSIIKRASVYILAFKSICEVKESKLTLRIGGRCGGSFR
jgi:hypothetical protein